MVQCIFTRPGTKIKLWFSFFLSRLCGGKQAFLIDKTPGARKAWKFHKAGHGKSIPLLETMLLEPYAVWLTPQKNESGQVRLSKRYIGFWKTKDKERIGGLAVYEVVDGIFTGVTNFCP